MKLGKLVIISPDHTVSDTFTVHIRFENIWIFRVVGLLARALPPIMRSEAAQYDALGRLPAPAPRKRKGPEVPGTPSLRNATDAVRTLCANDCSQDHRLSVRPILDGSQSLTG